MFELEIISLLKKNNKPLQDSKLLIEYKEECNLKDETFNKILNDYLENDYPIQYIVGYEYFFGKKIMVNKYTLIPRMETEEVVLELIKNIKKEYKTKSKLKVLDLCTGSGAITIGINTLIGDTYEIEFHASDISDNALEVARNNFSKHDMDVKVKKSDLLEEYIDIEVFDIIISNPPYIAKNTVISDEVRKYEPHLALFAENEGLYFYKKIIDNLNGVLNSKAIVCFEIGDGQGESIVEYAINNSSFYKNDIIKDMNKRERVVILGR